MMPFAVGIGDESLVIARHGGDHSRGSVGGSGDDAASCGVLFIHGHRVDGDPVERGERIASFALRLPLLQTPASRMRAAARSAAGENAFGRNTPIDAAVHDFPDTDGSRRAPILQHFLFRRAKKAPTRCAASVRLMLSP